MSSLLRKFVLTCLFILCLGFSIAATASEPVTESAEAEQKQVAYQIRDLLFERHYDQAKKEIENLLKRWPDQLIGYAGMMIYYQLRNIENFDMRFDAEFEKWIEPGRDRAEAVINDPNATSWQLFLAGGTLSMSGFYYFRNGHTFRALGDGLTGIHALQIAKERNPDDYDPWLGIGGYNYWRSVYTKQYSFLPFFPDKRQAGIDMLEVVRRRGSFAKELSQGALAYIYFNEGDYGKAYKYNEQLITQYPANVILRTLKGQLLIQMKRYKDAKEQFELNIKTDPTLSTMYLYMAYLEFDRVDTKFRPRGEVYAGITPSEIEAYNQIIPTIKQFIGMAPAPRMKARGYDLWAEILFRQGDIKGAKKKTKEALQLDYSLSSARGRQQQLRH